MQRPSAERPQGKDFERLTEREVEVLRLVARGLSNQEIGDELFVSPATAKTHVSRLLMKLAARDRAQLIVIAYETGWSRPDPALADRVAFVEQVADMAYRMTDFDQALRDRAVVRCHGVAPELVDLLLELRCRLSGPHRRSVEARTVDGHVVPHFRSASGCGVTEVRGNTVRRGVSSDAVRHATPQWPD